MKRKGIAVRQVLNRIGEIWCRIQHPAPRWPINGQYECPACLRRYAVVWANDSTHIEPSVTHRALADSRRAMPAGPALTGRAALAARL